MPQVEAAACGVPVMSIDYSAMSSVIRKLKGEPLKIIGVYPELETGCNRAVPDNDYAAQKIEEFFNLSESERAKKGRICREMFEKFSIFQDFEIVKCLIFKNIFRKICFRKVL